MNDNADRRRFFRITDTLGVAYRVISAEEQSSDELQSQSLDVHGLIAHYSDIINHSAITLESQDPALSQAIDALNKKLDCIISQLELKNLLSSQVPHQLLEVNISACGIAFIIDEALKSGEVLALELFFKPEELHVLAKGRVVDCEMGEDGNYYLRVEFLEIPQADQERLIQYIVQRQGALLRSLRDI